MEDRMTFTHGMRFCLLVVLVLLTSLATAAAQNCSPSDPCVALGSDYFQTVPGNGQSGTYFNFGGIDGLGLVDFMGVQIGPGSTDTIVERLSNSPPIQMNDTPIGIQLEALSLESIAPVDIGGYLYNMFIGLNPADQSTGTITIMGTLQNGVWGGTFTSSFNLYFEASFQPTNGGPPVNPIPGEATLGNTGAQWSSKPTSGDLLVPGPLGDQAANCHTGTGPYGCLNPSGSDNGYVDFFPGEVTECESYGCHVVVPASTPEPSTLLLLGPAAVGIFWRLRSRPV
jgi:hypothetical protein